jgi:ATP-dependent Clp protease ATP-binding subunit ClpB
LKAASHGNPFLLNVTDSARELLLREGTDLRYGARHLKRAIERLLVQPLSNLMATGQARGGDCIRVTATDDSPALSFSREVQPPQWAVARRAA